MIYLLPSCDFCGVARRQQGRFIIKTIAIIALILCCSCTLTGAAEPPLGTWEWFSTEVAAGEFVTPIEIGYTVQFEFNEDGTFVEYRDQNMHYSGLFWVGDTEYQGHYISVLQLDYGDVNPAECAFGIAVGNVPHMYWGGDSQTGLPSFPLERYLARDAVAIDNGSWGAVKLLYR